MPIERNELESQRFGIVGAKVCDPLASPHAVEAAAAMQGVDLLSVRIPATELTRVHAYEAAGYRLMDTLVYFSRSLEDLSGLTETTVGLTCRDATHDDLEDVARVARAAFEGYIGHYHMDPRLDRAAADAAYVEWAETSVANAGTDAPAIVAEADGAIVGFVTLQSTSETEMEIVLNAVDPDMQKRGVYATLISSAVRLSAARSALAVIVSTQINNYAVQRVWSRLGFTPLRALYTLHRWRDDTRRKAP